MRLKTRAAQLAFGFSMALLMLSMLSMLSAPSALAQGGAGSGWSFDWDIEGKFHYRDSDATAVQSPFPFDPPEFLTTVDPGEHFEVSTATLYLSLQRGEFFTAKAKIDYIDRYDRNPTSEDKDLDVDELWLRFGREVEPGELPARGGGYLKIGKFPHFERQDDRHLESYGLISTAFNRFEDTGLELGIDLGRHFYLKASATQGNPVFIRDPNALAGDNGLAGQVANPPVRSDLGSGLVIFYDAEVEDPDFDNLEIGVALGFRVGQTWTLDVLLWGYERDLAERVDLEGTLYNGDLAVLDGPIPTSVLPFRGNKKEEFGANLWFYAGGLSVFAQFVDGEIAELPRDGWEVEVAYAFELPLRWSFRGRQLFTYIQPVVRFSQLDSAIPGSPGSRHFPAVTARWDWEKIDYGLRLGVYEGIDLTVEFSDNTTTTLGGTDISNDEFLTTLRWKF